MRRSPKYIQVNWIGPQVPAMKRIGALSAKPLAAEVFTTIGVFVDTNDRADLNAKALAQRLLASGGAHKPLWYEFGNGTDKFELSSLETQ